MRNRSSISEAQSYRDIGEFWDTHDLADHWDRTEPAEFEVDILSEITYYALDRRWRAKRKFQYGISRNGNGQP